MGSIIKMSMEKSLTLVFGRMQVKEIGLAKWLGQSRGMSG